MPGSLPQSSSRWPSVFAMLGALALGVGLFLIIPLTQALNHGDLDPVTYRQMAHAAPPPPPQMPPPPEEEKAYEEEVKPEPPKLEHQLNEVPIQQLSLSLSPGMGVALQMGVPSMPKVQKVDTVGEIEKIFNFDELAQPPTVINKGMIWVEFPRELSRRGVRKAEVVMQILIDKRGRVRVEKFLSQSYDHPKLRESARKTAAQIRFTITKVDGRAVEVRGRFPLTLQAPR
ncbi:MAG: hypothetical protein CMO80_18730 [Verrucomicrobiales bacterium]|nr:hypothetical protein [Verrucomicrobiales bacterium]